jgi:hypothetical protein
MKEQKIRLIPQNVSETDQNYSPLQGNLIYDDIRWCPHLDFPTTAEAELP